MGLRNRHSRLRKRRDIRPSPLIVIPVLWLTLVVAIPLIVLVVFSFFSETPALGPAGHLTLNNYKTVFEEPVYLHSLRVALVTAAAVTAIDVVLGFCAAYAILQVKRAGLRRFLFLIVVMPLWTSTLIRAYSWAGVLGPHGLFAWTWGEVVGGGDGPSFLYSYTAVLIALVQEYLPYTILTCYVALEHVDPELRNAALTLGARPMTAFRRITLQLALPGVLVGALLTFIPVSGVFMEPEILGGPGTVFLGSVINSQFFQTLNWPLGTALAVVLLACVGLVLAAGVAVGRGRTALRRRSAEAV